MTPDHENLNDLRSNMSLGRFGPGGYNGLSAQDAFNGNLRGCGPSGAPPLRDQLSYGHPGAVGPNRHSSGFTAGHRPEAYSAAYGMHTAPHYGMPQYGSYQLTQPAPVAAFHPGYYGAAPTYSGHGGIFAAPAAAAAAAPAVASDPAAAAAPAPPVASHGPVGYYAGSTGPVGGTGYAGTAQVSGYAGTASLGGMYAGSGPVGLGYAGQYGSFASGYASGAAPPGVHTAEQSAEMAEAIKKSEEAWKEVREQGLQVPNGAGQGYGYPTGAAAYGGPAAAYAQQGYMAPAGYPVPAGFGQAAEGQSQAPDESASAGYPSMSERYSQLMSRHGIASAAELDQIAQIQPTAPADYHESEAMPCAIVEAKLEIQQASPELHEIVEDIAEAKLEEVASPSVSP